MSKLSKSLVTTIAVCALSAPVIVSAGPKNDLEGTAVKVSYSDLNLQDQKGAQTLYRRLQSAAKQACSVRSLQAEGSVERVAKSKSCYRETLTAAVAEVGNSNVSKIHAG